MSELNGGVVDVMWLVLFVYSLRLAFYFCWLCLGFKICSFVKISMSKMSKNQTLVGIFCNNPRANGKILLGFCRWNQVDANIWEDDQTYGAWKYVHTCSHLYSAAMARMRRWITLTQGSFQFGVCVFSFQLSLNRNDYACFAIANCCQYEQPLKLGQGIITYSVFSSQTWIWVCVSVCCVDISDAEAHFWQK